MAPPADAGVGMRMLGAVDRVRRWWLWRLGGWGRVLVRHRELRVCVVFSTVVVTALLGTMIAPLWLLALGPLVWGIPHLVADLRYLVVRTGYGQRPRLLLLGGLPLLSIGLGADLTWGFVGGIAVALAARADLRRRLFAVGLLGCCAAGLLALGDLSDVVFGHAHNFAALGLWWIWRPRRTRLHWIPVALLLAAIAFLLSPLALDGMRALGGLAWFPAGEDSTRQLWRLAPGLSPDLGLRLVLLFCLMQSVHYALWLHMLPDEDRERSTAMTFRASYRQLERDIGSVGVWVAMLLGAGIIVWAVLDLSAAGRGYFRMARFHGHLEIMAVVVLLLERRRRPT